MPDDRVRALELRPRAVKRVLLLCALAFSAPLLFLIVCAVQ